MELSFWAATDVGKKREINEDNFLVDKKLSLFVVADGMGGHASGEVASKLAVHEFRNAVEAGREAVDKFAKGDATVRPQDVLTAARERGPGRGPGRLPQGAGRAGEARHGDDRLRAADRGRPRLHRARRRQPHLHAARRPGRAAHRGPLAGQRAHPPRPRHQGELRDLAVQGVQERGHARGRRLRDRPGRHHRLRDPARRPVPALLGRAARLPERRAHHRPAQGRRRQGAAQEADRHRQRGRRPRQHHRRRRAHRAADGRGGHDAADRRSRRGAGAQGRRAPAHAALPPPGLQGDPARC